MRLLWKSKMILKMQLASWFFVYFFKSYRSFNTVSIKSVGQRTLKLLAVKSRGLKKKSATCFRPHLNQLTRIWVCPGSNHSQSLMACNFAALWPTDLIILAKKDLNLLQSVVKFQLAGSILRLTFALSQWPHLHWVYLVTVQ